MAKAAKTIARMQMYQSVSFARMELSIIQDVT